MRCVDQWVVVRWPFAGSDSVGFALDADHRFDKSVDLGKVLALCRLDHERSRNRERHRRRVETVVNQSLGDIVNRYTGLCGQWTEVEDTLVGHKSVFTRVQNGEVLAKAGSHIVRR